MSPEQQEINLDAEGNLVSREHPVSLSGVYAFPDRTVPRKDVRAFKFGGSSILGAERMIHAAALVRDATRASRVIVIVSAMKGVTNRLLEIAQHLDHREWEKARKQAGQLVDLHVDTLNELQLQDGQATRVRHEVNLLARDFLHETQPQRRSMTDDARFDRLASFGERFSARLFAAALEKVEGNAVPVASSDFVLTCDNFRDAKPHLEYTRDRGREILLPLLESGIVPVVTGFIGATHDGRITTLGRNSSDYSGAIIAHVVDAEELVIWTDVDGIYTSNPRECTEAQLLHEMSYDEAHALAANGAKVLHPEVLPLAAQTQMTVWVRNTFKPHMRGTRIGPVQNGGAA